MSGCASVNSCRRGISARGEAGGDADGQVARRGPQGVGRVGDQFEGAANFGHIAAPNVGEGERPRVALEQLQAEGDLQTPHLLRHRALNMRAATGLILGLGLCGNGSGLCRLLPHCGNPRRGGRIERHLCAPGNRLADRRGAGGGDGPILRIRRAGADPYRSRADPMGLATATLTATQLSQLNQFLYSCQWLLRPAKWT